MGTRQRPVVKLLGQYLHVYAHLLQVVCFLMCALMRADNIESVESFYLQSFLSFRRFKKDKVVIYDAEGNILMTEKQDV